MSRRFLAAVAILSLSVTALWAFGRKSPEQRRAEIMEIQGQTMSDLYRLRPAAKELVNKSVGTAVFSTKGMKIMVAGSARGRGVIIEKANGKKTFMKMQQVKVGLGYGLQDARFVFIFQDKKAIDDFASMGWDFSGGAEMAAAAKDKGGSLAGAVSFMPGVLVYQFTKNGLAAEITLSGTKFWADKKLNASEKESAAIPDDDWE